MKIVIADDSAKVRQIWRAMLINLGHEVVGEGADGHEAVRLCASHRPDLAILDMSMGDYGGGEAIDEILAANTSTYVLLCTSRGSVKEFFESKGVPVLIKPIMQGNLERKIAEIVKG